MLPTLSIRPAVGSDLPTLHRLAERAVWELLAGRHYSEHQMESARAARAYQVEERLVHERTYYVVEVDGTIAGGSGWSPEGTFHPSHNPAAEETGPLPAAGAAIMRASYVDPDFGRRGLATLLARVTEAAACLAGYRRFEALCTPASEGLRRILGYELVERVDLDLGDGVTISMAHMRKEIGA
jgi:GNAT superfamily N-acetyltransferase